MKIHGIVWVLVGVFVSSVSYFSTNESLGFFLYVGLVFFTFGIFKLIIGYIFKEKKEKPRVEKRPAEKEKGFVKHCSKCHLSCRVTDNFCPRCGNGSFYRG